MNSSRIVKVLSLAFIFLIVIGGIKAISLYQKVYAPSISTQQVDGYYLYIHPGYTFDSVLLELEKAGIVRNVESFKWTAKQKNYPNHIYPGRYLLTHRMSNNELVNLLRSGEQEPLMLTFNNIRTLGEFAKEVSLQLAFDSVEFMNYMNDTDLQHSLGLGTATLPCLFIPNSYEFYWNVSVKGFVKRMKKEYDSFWSKSRKAKAEKLKLNPEEVITLASIVNLETRKDDEKSKIAGVYLNRIKIGMPLQADPTIVFALGDFGIRRVLNKHKKIDSPYNTYKYRGLPPGPICFPDISSIDAVLDRKKHSYLYFCAKPDFSGYHTFAKTLKKHNQNARAYQRELNKRRIYR